VSGSYQVTAAPGPAGYTPSRRTPAGGSGTGHADAVSCVQSQAGARRQNAPSLAEPGCGLTKTHRKTESATPTHHHSEEVLRACEKVIRGQSRSIAEMH
jgi:hypothetical protein